MLYETGTGLAVPGVESVMEYGDADAVRHDTIPGGARINDRSSLERIHVTDIGGLNDDPDGRESRQPNPDRHGERAGSLLHSGRTVTLSGQVRAGNIRAMRDTWRRFRRALGSRERDLLLHVPDEVVLYANEIVNPRLSSDAYGWSASSPGDHTFGGGVSVDGVPMGRIEISNAPSGAGSISAYGAGDSAPEWEGEDVWLFARVKVGSMGHQLDRVELRLRFLDGEGAAVATLAPSAGSPLRADAPALGYYEVSGRIPRSSFPAVDFARVAAEVAMVTRADAPANSFYRLYIAQAALVLVRPGDPDPPGYIDGDVPGHEWAGRAGRSRSAGPSYAVNQAADPLSGDPGEWISDSSNGAVVERAPVATRSWDYSELAGSSGTSISFRVSSPSATPRVLALRTPQAGGCDVYAGRKYSATLLVSADEVPAGSSARYEIVFRDFSGAILAVAQSDPVQGGTADIASVTAVAPARAVSAHTRLVASADQAGEALDVRVAHPTFVDVSAHDPGPFAGDEDDGYSASVPGRSPRRLIPRPWLLRKVRKVPGDPKAPEKQERGRAWRDFQVALRASDPRIYALDERVEEVTLSGTPKFVSQTPPQVQYGVPLGYDNILASDDFAGTSAGVSLHGRNAPVGATAWATSGSGVGDLKFVDPNYYDPANPSSTANNPTEAVARDVTGERFGVLGPAVANQRVSANVMRGTAPNQTGSHYAGILARYVDDDNWAALASSFRSGSDLFGPRNSFVFIRTVNGSQYHTTLSNVGVGSGYNKLVLTITSDGTVSCLVYDKAGTLVAQLNTQHGDFAAGGALASGKGGIYDDFGYASKRWWDSFELGSPVDVSGFAYDAAEPAQAGGSPATYQPYALRGGFVIKPPEAGSNQGWYTRFYRSSEGHTYAEPMVIVGGYPNGNHQGDVAVGPSYPNYNWVGPVLKRTSSDHWLSVVFNGHGGPGGVADHLEIWSNRGGSSAPLAGASLPIFPPTGTYVRAWMEGAVVRAQLWQDYPSPDPDDPNLLLEISAELTGSDLSEFGPAVAGHAGAEMMLGIGSGSATAQPALWHFEARDASIAPASLAIPVIGDMATPPTFELRGDVVNPVIAMAGPEGEGPTSTVAAFSGLFSESEPTIVDVGEGRVTDADGTDRYGDIWPGSRFRELDPDGLNQVTFSAASFGQGPHLIVRWRDTVR